MLKGSTQLHLIDSFVSELGASLHWNFFGLK